MRGTLIMSVACKLWFHHLRCHDGWILEDANSRSGSLDRLIKVHFGNYHFCCGCHQDCLGGTGDMVVWIECSAFSVQTMWVRCYYDIGNKSLDLL
ncbi:hypothetical protein CDAR_208031 [Caerostris darwini]|uniref:Uncharacterized protein n=1 Tax=Caerostris darwini TaxID=1538125 RepID=A0AAV4U3M3_9ARAC|nr:hypothetical protein CDAR_208031 [Caerostris darwini]